MPPSLSDMRQIADAVGADLAGAAKAGVLRTVGEMFARTGAGPQLVATLLKEARLKSPGKLRLAGYCALLSATLECLRLDMNGGRSEAADALSFTADYLAGPIEHGGIDPAVLIDIGRAFAFARVTPPEALRRTLGAATDERVQHEEEATGSLDRLPDIFAGLGDDCFAIHEERLASSAAYPTKHRFAIAAGLSMSASSGARAAAIGFLLDPDDELAALFGFFLAEQGSKRPVSSQTIERMVRLRPWLAPRRQAPVDAALRALRPHALAPVATPARIREAQYATPVDGAGAQSLFVLVRQGRKLALASILVKLDKGVVDAWAQPDLTRKRASEMIGRVRMEAGALPVSPAYVEQRLADGLVINLRKDPPPFGLIQALETLGAGQVFPTVAEPSGMLSELCGAYPLLIAIPQPAKMPLAYPEPVRRLNAAQLLCTNPSDRFNNPSHPDLR